jgi:hypothetical protein
VLNYNNTFTVAERLIADQGRNSVFALNDNIRNMHLNRETELSVFHCYVNSIFNYGSEVCHAEIK